MQSPSNTTIGIIGSGALAILLAQRLAGSCSIVSFASQGGALAGAEHADNAVAEHVDNAVAFASRTKLVLWAEPSDELDATSELAAALQRGTTVVDLTGGDPDQARGTAEALAARGIAFVDAPIHCEQLSQFPEDAAVLLGGTAAAVADVRPLLEQLGATVVACGDVGSGRAMHTIVAAVAVCNRLVTYECAAMGAQNGLTVADIGSVLNRCSGANSATARVLPALVAGTHSAEAPLAEAAADLAMCTKLARRLHAPALMAHQAAAQVLAASRTLDPGSTLDDLRSLVERGSDLRFTA